MNAKMTLEDRITRLEAYRAIERLIADLGDAFDSGPSAKALRGLFTADAEFRIDQYGVLHGADAIADGVAGNADKGFSWTLHYLVSPRIDLAATASSADIEFMLWEVATADGDAWRFARLELKADLISRYAEGWRDKPAALDRA